MRLDQYIPAQTSEFSRTFLRQVVDLGGVHVGGRRIRRCSHPVKAGESVEVFLDGLPLAPFVLEDRHILFRDRYLLALNKPPGVETQPTPARFKGTLYHALQSYLQDPFRPMDQPGIGMVQRLDRETSGVIVFSVHPRSHRELTRIFSSREVGKKYLALIKGQPENREGEIRSNLARSRGTNLMKSVPRGGKEAITFYRVREEFSGAALLEIEIPTGRSHQIRAHLGEIGHPLLGDRRYGGPGEEMGLEIPRQMLHAWRLSFRHPVTGGHLDLEAPIPEDMASILKEFRGAHDR